VYHIKIPALEFDKKFIDEIGPFCLNKKRTQYQRGLDFFRNVDGLLSG
jgi:hypothetical protein